MPGSTAERWTESDVPARLDRLPWSGWHWLIVVALGITWVLDGLEVTLAGVRGRRPQGQGQPRASATPKSA